MKKPNTTATHHPSAFARRITATTTTPESFAEQTKGRQSFQGVGGRTGKVYIFK
jgi:hypothetical protein